MRFVTHARTVAVITFLSRITGLARDATLSRVFGAGVIMDAFFFAFLIPNLFRRLFGEGALSAAFLPVYAQLNRDDPETARGLATLVIGSLVGALALIVVITEFALALVLVQLDSPSLVLRLTMVLLPYMPLVCLVAFLGAMLQVHDRFGPTAAAPIVLNLCMIAAAVLGGSLGVKSAEWHIGLVAASVVVAGLLQVAWSLAALRRHRCWQRPTAAVRAPLRRVLGQALPMILGLGVLQFNVLLDGLIASYPSAVGPTIFGVEYPLTSGAMSSVSFAQRLYQFPLGVFGVALATAIFPALARTSDDDNAYRTTVQHGLRLVMFIGLPASVGLVLVRGPLVSVILEGGAFTADDAGAVSFVLLGYAVGVWAYSAIHILTRAFYARSDAKTPVRVAVGVVALNLALNLTLIWTPLREAGLAWSTAICAFVQTVVLVALLARRHGPVLTASVRRSWLRSAGLTVAMGGAVFALLALTPAPTTWTSQLITLTAAVGAGIAVFGLGARWLRMAELQWLLKKSD